MGDWNARIGNEQVGGIVGNYGLGGTDERGMRLTEICRDRKTIIMNTWFKHHRRRLYTWRAPGDRYRKQIDFILVEERYRNGVKQVCGLPGADIYSDHVLLKLELDI
ncbi:hypothetical protein J437_LFUL014044 [Ladona fulva]|uniref:Endonuclease/exonuclease/phosphatase domain-containing protein n=1 Tax=Ladona fulva TaxID=123851 RepID=A0A8K0P4L1_LADFU|nr:hypothetical protein J437_LFUL014044 [Ladona fulva]